MKVNAKNSRVFLFEDKPLFGMDIGHDTIRVMEFDMSRKHPKIRGYGSVEFNANAIENGVIVKPEVVARAAMTLFKKDLKGDISTKRVAVSLPANRALTRAIRLPKMSEKDIADAVQTEIEQNLPAHIDTLYIDYTKLREDAENLEVFVVAMPREVVDSYLVLTRMLGLEAVLFDTAIGASARLFAFDKQSSIPSVLVDFGANNTDITVFNQGLVVSGTVAFGGDDITRMIVRNLGVTQREAVMLKSKYGLAKSAVQDQLIAAADPSLTLLIKEVRRTIRYYEQRYTKEEPIGQVMIMGGGANMPGLAEHLTERIHLPVRTFDPSAHFDFGPLRSFYDAERMSYVTAAGLAITDPREVFA